MSRWKRSFFGGRYSRGPFSFAIKPQGRAGHFVYDGIDTYMVPYEYGDPALFHIWVRGIKKADDSRATVPAEKQLEIRIFGPPLERPTKKM